MKEAITNLINKWACCHEWELVRTVNVRDDFGGCYTVYHYHCSKCGKMKKVKSS